VIAHHVTIRADRGISQKPTDYWCVPLDFFVHEKLHHMGEKEFWRQANHKPHSLIEGYLIRYINDTADVDAKVELNILRSRGLL